MGLMPHASRGWVNVSLPWLLLAVSCCARGFCQQDSFHLGDWSHFPVCVLQSAQNPVQCHPSEMQRGGCPGSEVVWSPSLYARIFPRRLRTTAARTISSTSFYLNSNNFLHYSLFRFKCAFRFSKMFVKNSMFKTKLYIKMFIIFLKNNVFKFNKVW